MTCYYGSNYRGVPLTGALAPPGDKSLSHRVALFAAMAEGTSRVHGLLDSFDVRSSLEAIAALGAKVELAADENGGLSGSITGWGAEGPHVVTHAEGSCLPLYAEEPHAPVSAEGPRAPAYVEEPHAPARHTIDCGNSGTTARLLLGLLSGYLITLTLTGDASLSARPMLRVIKPLTQMGACFEPSGQTTLPLTLRGSAELSAIDYCSPVASAQVKSAVLLAGLNAKGTTTVTEPRQSRNHTELLLPSFGVNVEVADEGLTTRISGGQSAKACDCTVPGDVSSAAFLLVAAALVPESEVCVRGVSLNPTRTGFLSVMRRMGAKIAVETSESGMSGSEPVGDIRVCYIPGLTATTVEPDEIPSLIDELPILALLATAASGITTFCEVGELRVKESNRLAAIIDGLKTLGCNAYTEGDNLFVEGSVPPFVSNAIAADASPSAIATDHAGSAIEAAFPAPVSAAAPDATCAPSVIAPNVIATPALVAPVSDAAVSGKLSIPTLKTHGDHRLAMTWVVAARALALDIDIDGLESIGVSYSRFLNDLERLGAL